MLASLFAEVELIWEGWNLQGSFLLLAILLVLACLHFLHVSKTKRQPRGLQPASSSTPTAPVTAMEAPPPPAIFYKPKPSSGWDKRNRRKWPRRDGNWVDVWVCDELLKTPPTEGKVIDRSRGGLQLSVAQPAAVDTNLKVRAVHAPEDSEWVQVTVRRCRQRGDRWLLGCAFQDELPWGLLLLFG